MALGLDFDKIYGVEIFFITIYGVEIGPFPAVYGLPQEQEATVAELLGVSEGSMLWKANSSKTAQNCEIYMFYEFF